MKNFFRAICVLCVLALFFLLSACSSSNKSASFGKEDTNPNANQQVALNGDAKQNEATQTIDSTALVGRKIIKTATVDIETLQYDICKNSFEALVNSTGGFIQASNVEGTSQNMDANSSRKATYTVRIPANKLNEFLKNVGNIGVVKNSSTSGEDVSEQYFDTESRLTSLRVEEDRLLAIKAKANSLSELLELEKRMTEVRTQIEQYTGQLKKLDALVDLATVNVNINEVKKIEAQVPDNFLNKTGYIFMSSLSVLFEGVKLLILVIIAIMPFAVVIGIIGIIIYFILKKIRKTIKK